MSKIVITGIANGLGRELGRLLTGSATNWVIGIDQLPDGLVASKDSICNEYISCDLNNPARIRETCKLITALDWQVDILINCAGINEINWIEDLDPYEFSHVMDINARAMFLMAQGLLPHLKESKGTILNIISNASHMPMTASLAYNASKGAAHIMTLQMARELTRKYGITVFGISPNKMYGTGMSGYIEERVCKVRGWTPEHAAEYQRNVLLTGMETDPAVLAEFIAYLLYNKRNHQYLSGCVIPYGA